MIDSADKNNIETILTKYQLTVPDYQRPYQWKKSEAIEFWEDLMSYYEDYKANTNNAGNLFLGTFIFLEKVIPIMKLLMDNSVLPASLFF